MREILFRGKRIGTSAGEWVEGFYVERGNKHWIYPAGNQTISRSLARELRPFHSAKSTQKIMHEVFPVDPYTVGQYTGMMDKNGKRIFEGDIVESVFSLKPYLVCFGKYTYTDEYGEEEGAAGWYNEEEGGYKTAMACTDVWAIVIGNIYDNPELMEEKNNE
jgi:uncharacterized phage protein (TIGR01671 family)